MILICFNYRLWELSFYHFILIIPLFIKNIILDLLFRLKLLLEVIYPRRNKLLIATHILWSSRFLSIKYVIILKLIDLILILIMVILVLLWFGWKIKIRIIVLIVILLLILVKVDKILTIVGEILIFIDILAKLAVLHKSILVLNLFHKFKIISIHIIYAWLCLISWIHYLYGICIIIILLNHDFPYWMIQWTLILKILLLWKLLLLILKLIWCLLIIVLMYLFN